MADVAAVAALIPLSARVLQAPYYDAEQIEGALGTVFGVDTQLIRDGTYFIAEAGGAIVGCGGWSRRRTLFGADAGRVGEDPPLDPRVDAARIRAFFVHPQWARRGIGRRLMQLSEAAARAHGFTRIEIVATLAGEPLYRSFGYAAIERIGILLPNGRTLPGVRMGATAAGP
jgi:GNAT superfamily N-acetyltransferase